MKTKKYKGFFMISTIIMVPLLLSACGASQAHEEGMGWTHKTPVEPNAGEWKALEMKDGKTYKLEAPPANDSVVTKAELQELQQITKHRTEKDIELIHYWSGATVSPYQRWFEVTEAMIKKYKLSPPAASRVHAMLSNAFYTASTATYDEKYHHLRPRPTDLDSTIELPEGFNVPAHPSYPSGHSATGSAASTILSYIFPHEADTFQKMLEECSTSRINAGIHFKTDIVAGEQLGKVVATDLIEKAKEDKEAPVQYMEMIHGPSGH